MRNDSVNRLWKVPALYPLLRAMVRFVVRLWRPKVRLLNSARLPASHPALLILNYPASFRFALMLAAALDRSVLFLLPPQAMRGTLQRLIGRGLGIIPIDPAAEDPPQSLSQLTSAWANWETIALFAGHTGNNPGEEVAGADLAVHIAFAAAEQQLQPAVFALHSFLPPGTRKTAPLLYFHGPIRALSSPEGVPQNHLESQAQLGEAVQNHLQDNVFALAPSELEYFRRDLEDITHEEIREEWSQLPDWKQQPADLHLSGLVRQWIEEQNQADPGRLVTLRNQVEDYREARRRCSLNRLSIETSAGWQESGFRVALAWLESVAGFPIALYGLANHAAPGVILFLSGLLKKSAKRDPKVEWLLRAFVVLSCYTLQVLLLDLVWGRAAAGYYALTLPLSGAYLWRYRWLARNRGRHLLLKLTLPRRSVRLQRTRGNLLENLEREIALYMESLGMPS